MIFIKYLMVLKSRQVGTEGMAFDGGQFGVARGEFGKWVNVFRIKVFIFFGEFRETEHKQVIGCILN
jgi:hypothetical protein